MCFLFCSCPPELYDNDEDFTNVTNGLEDNKLNTEKEVAILDVIAAGWFNTPSKVGSKSVVAGLPETPAKVESSQVVAELFKGPVKTEQLSILATPTAASGQNEEKPREKAEVTGGGLHELPKDTAGPRAGSKEAKCENFKISDEEDDADDGGGDDVRTEAEINAVSKLVACKITKYARNNNLDDRVVNKLKDAGDDIACEVMSKSLREGIKNTSAYVARMISRTTSKMQEGVAAEAEAVQGYREGDGDAVGEGYNAEGEEGVEEYDGGDAQWSHGYDGEDDGGCEGHGWYGDETIWQEEAWRQDAWGNEREEGCEGYNDDPDGDSITGGQEHWAEGDE
jgi:hypothetical protein